MPSLPNWCRLLYRTCDTTTDWILRYHDISLMWLPQGMRRNRTSHRGLLPQARNGQPNRLWNQNWAWFEMILMEVSNLSLGESLNTHTRAIRGSYNLQRSHPRSIHLMLLFSWIVPVYPRVQRKGPGNSLDAIQPLLSLNRHPNISSNCIINLKQGSFNPNSILPQFRWKFGVP